MDDEATVAGPPPQPTRRLAITVRHAASHPRNALYEVEQGHDRYYVVARSEDDVFTVAAERLLEHPERCSWPPLISEVVR